MGRKEKVHLTDEGVCRIKERILKLQYELERNERSLRRTIDQLGLGDQQTSDRLDRKFELQAEIEKWQDILKNSSIITKSKEKTPQVTLGSTVELINKDVSRKIQVVCSVEADPSVNKISDKSPLGSTILGRKKGDTVIVPMPMGEAKFKINAIE